MTLHLEIVTPERLVYSDDVDGVKVPGSDGELGILPHHAPLVATLGVGELRIRKGGSEESIAMIGGFLQVRPDKVVVMAESGRPRFGDRPRAGPAGPARRREGARRRLPAGCPTCRRPGPSSSGPSSDIRVAERRHREGPRQPRVAAVADARPFHWEFTPEPVAREVFRIEGGRPLHGTVAVSGSKNAALKLLAAATLTGERCRFTNVPEIEDVRVMADTLRDLGVVVDHPAPNVYEVASGDVDWLFVPLEAAAKMRAIVHPPRPAPDPLRPGDHQQPRRRPDRPPAGQPPRRRDARAGGRDRVPQRLLLRPLAGPPAGHRPRLPVRVGDGHRERDAGRGPGRRPDDDPAGGGRSPRSTT